MEASWPLVGRIGELRWLESLVADPARRGVVLAGAAGVGKTRLALECLAAAEGEGLATARATATQTASAIPLGALAPLVPAIEEMSPAAGGNRAGVLRRAASALVEAAGERRLVLMVDDAHLLDDASATLLQHLALANSAFLLLTVRSGLPIPDSLVALWKDGLLERVDIHGLPAESTQELLTQALRGLVDPAAATLLAARSQANILVLREMVFAALEQGILRDQDGIWQLWGPISPSNRLVELVESRLIGLDPDARKFLEMVSFGEPLGAGEIAALADPDTVEDLERKGLVAGFLNGRRLEVRPAHPIYGEVLRASVPAIRAQGIARSLAETVERAGARRRVDTLRVGTWRLTGGGGGPSLLMAAATAARWHYDFALAERLARAAVDAGSGFEAALLLAQLGSLQGRGTEAEEQLAGLARAATDDFQRSRVAITRIDNSILKLRPAEGLRMAEDAEKTIEDPELRGEVAAHRAVLVLSTQGPKAAAEISLPLVEETTAGASMIAALAAAASLNRLGRLEASYEIATRGHATALGLSSPHDWYPWFPVFSQAEALAYLGRLEEAERVALAEYEKGVADRSPEAQAYFAWALARIVGERGHVQTAIRYAQESLALFRQLERPMFIRDSMQYLALAMALSGKPQEAADVLRRLDELNLPPSMYAAVDLLQARGWTAAAGGDLPGARQFLHDAAALGEEIGDLVSAAAALHGLARLGRGKDILERLTDLGESIEGDLVKARLAHTRALVRNDAEALDDASMTFEALGADLLAADAAAAAVAPWRRKGNNRAAAASQRRATLFQERCEGATTPTLQTVDVSAQLTPAEKDAALLAAAGRSNREIADELCLSERSIENRLQRVYEKLGVSGRRELRKVFETG